MTKTDTTTKAPVSFASLNITKLGGQPYEFEVDDDEGKPQGWFMSVLSDQSDKVKTGVQALLDARRAADAARELNPVANQITPAAEDYDFAVRSAALRICGWRNLDVEYSEELALELCSVNMRARQLAMSKSARVTNFTQR